MKLHLPKGIRTTLLACVCGAFAVASMAMAEDAISMESAFDTSNYKLSSDTVYDLTTYTQNQQFGVFLGTSGDSTNVTLHTDSENNITIYKIYGKDSASYIKSGSGTLTISGYDTHSPGYVTVAGGTLKLAYGQPCIGLTVNSGAELVIAENTTTTVTGTLTLGGTITNNGTLALSDGATVDASALSLDLSALTSTTATKDIYSNGNNGFKGTGNVYTYTPVGGTVTMGNNVFITISESVQGMMLSSSTFETLDASVYYVREGTVSHSSATMGDTIEVNSGATLNTGETTIGSLTLNDGGLLISQGQSTTITTLTVGAGGATVTAKEGNGTVHSALKGSVSGTGNLVLNGTTTTANGLDVYATIATSGTLTIQNKVNMTNNSVLNLYNTIENEGILSLAGALKVASEENLTKSDEIARTTDNGFGTIQVYLVNGTSDSTLSASVSTIASDSTVAAGSTLHKTDDGKSLYYTKNTDTYYVNTSAKYSSTDMNGATKIVVAADQTLTYDAKDCSTDIKLSGEGSTLAMSGQSVDDGVTVTLGGGKEAMHTIKGYSTSMRADVSGTGDLTLQNTDNKYVYLVKGEINNTGNVTIDGDVKMDKESDTIYGTFGSSVGTVTVAGGDKLTFQNGQENTISLNLDGGTVAISGKTYNGSSVDSTVVLASDSTLTSGTLDIDAGTLDLSNVLTLGGADIDLADGTTLVIGSNVYSTEEGITFSGTLTLGEGITIDMSDWCANADFQYMGTLFTYEGDDYETVLAGLHGLTVTLKLSDYTQNKAQLIVDGNKVCLIPEPTTATLSLLALAGLCARRRRK